MLMMVILLLVLLLLVAYGWVLVLALIVGTLIPVQMIAVNLLRAY